MDSPNVLIGSTIHNSMLQIAQKLSKETILTEQNLLQQKINNLWQCATDLFDGVVIIPILELPCINCSQHAVFEFLPQRIERNVQVILQNSQNKLEKYGYQVHKAVTETVSLHMLSYDEETENFSFADFQREIKPYLLQHPLKNYHLAHSGQCSYFSKPFKL